MNDSIVNSNTHIIVIGNEKGGAGKTTTSMHIITSLLHFGFSVGSVDLDSRQRSISRYIENRRETIVKQGLNVPLPSHAIVKKSPFNIVEEAVEDEKHRFNECLHTLSSNCDFIVVDTPGSDTNLSRYAHSFADHIITPINDSFVDLDVLAQIDSETLTIDRPGIYSEMIWEQKIKRAKRSENAAPIDWIVMRNRLTNIDANNKRRMAEAIGKLSKRIGFRSLAGFSERVIFRELFLHGLTLIDILNNKTSVSVNLSHIAARQELRDVLKGLRIPAVNECLGIEMEEEAKVKPTASKSASKPAPKAKATMKVQKKEAVKETPIQQPKQTTANDSSVKDAAIDSSEVTTSA